MQIAGYRGARGSQGKRAFANGLGKFPALTRRRLRASSSTLTLAATFIAASLFGNVSFVSGALAACVPASSGGSPTGTYSGTTASIVCDAANDTIDIISPASTGNVTLAAGNDKATVDGGNTGSVNGNAGNDLIILNPGAGTHGNLIGGNAVDSANDIDRIFMFGGSSTNAEVQTGAGGNAPSGESPYVFFMGGEMNGGSFEFRRGSKDAVLVFDGGTMLDGEVEFQSANATQGSPVDPTVYFRSGTFQGEFEVPNPNINTTVIFDPINSKDSAYFQTLANSATNGGDPTLSNANLNAALLNAPANSDPHHQMVFDVDEVELNTGNDFVIFNGAVNNGDGHHNLVLLGAEEEPGEFEITEFNGGGGFNSMFVLGGSNLQLGEVENFNFLAVTGDSALALTSEEYEFDSVVVGEGSTLGFSSETGKVQVEADEILVDGTSQLVVTGKTATFDVDHFELAGPGNGERFKPANYYKAFDPGGMLVLAGQQPEEDDDAESSGADEEVAEDDDEGSEAPIGPSRVTFNAGDHTFVNGGTINMINGITGDSLTINGPYQSNNGNLAVDTTLGTKKTDLLTVNGPVSGTTTVYVNNLNTKARQSAQDVTVVSAPDGGLSKNSFRLGKNTISGEREVIDGAFAYKLGVKNNKAYLYGDLLDQVPGYVMSASVAQTHVFSEFGTLYQRMGEMRNAATAANPYPLRPQAWVRGNFSQANVDASKGWDFDSDNQNILFGADLGGFPGIQMLRVGVFGGYGNTDATVKGTTFGRSANSSVDVNGWTEGVYMTYFDVQQPGVGFYFDGILKANQLDLGIRSATRSVSTSPNADSFSASGEIGYGIPFAGTWSLTPQGQLIGITVNEESFTDRFGVNVNPGDADAFIGRFGLQLQDSITTASGGVIAPYLVANIYSNFDGDTVSYVNGTKIASDIGATWGSFGGGLTASLGQMVDVYGSADYRFGDVEGWNGTVGLRAHW